MDEAVAERDDAPCIGDAPGQSGLDLDDSADSLSDDLELPLVRRAQQSVSKVVFVGLTRYESPQQPARLGDVEEVFAPQAAAYKLTWFASTAPRKKGLRIARGSTRSTGVCNKSSNSSSSPK